MTVLPGQVSTLHQPCESASSPTLQAHSLLGETNTQAEPCPGGKRSESSKYGSLPVLGTYSVPSVGANFLHRVNHLLLTPLSDRYCYFHPTSTSGN